jgi:hypothetical protein
MKRNGKIIATTSTLNADYYVGSILIFRLIKETSQILNEI